MHAVDVYLIIFFYIIATVAFRHHTCEIFGLIGDLLEHSAI